MRSGGWMLAFWLSSSAIAFAQEAALPPLAPPSAPAAIECFPACRAGYLCHQGQCISACNPVCEAGQVCTPEGQCAVSAPATAAVAAPVVVAPVVVTPNPAPSTLAGSAEAATTAESASDVGVGPKSRVWFDLVAYAGILHGERLVDGTFETRREEIAGVAAFSPGARMRFVRSGFMFDGAIPFAGGSRSLREDIPLAPGADRTSTSFGIGNPTASASGVLPLGDKGAWLSGGVGFALPLALIEDEPETIEEANDALSRGIALSLTMLAHGMWDPWRYAPNTFSVYFPLEIEGGTERVRVGAELAVARLIYVGKSDVQDDLTFAQFGGRVQATVSQRASLGLRLRVAHQVSPGNDPDIEDDEDMTQLSLEPFVEVEAGERMLFGAGWIVNLDEPAGPTSENLFVWGLRASLGVKL